MYGKERQSTRHATLRLLMASCISSQLYKTTQSSREGDETPRCKIKKATLSYRGGVFEAAY